MSPDPIDTDAGQRLAMLRNVLATCAAIAFAHLIVTLLATPAVPTSWYGILAGCVLAFIGLRAAATEATVDRVGVAFLCAATLAIVLGTVARPESLAYITSAAIVLVVLAGGLVGPGAAITVGLTFVALQLITFIAISLGYLPGPLDVSNGAVLIFETLTAAGMVAVLVRDRARVLQALRGERRRLEEIVEQAPDVLLTYADGKVLEVSPASESVLGMAPADLVGRSLAVTPLAALGSLIPGTDPVEIPLPHPERDQVVVEVHAQRGHTVDGGLVVRATLRDVSRRVRERAVRASLTEQLHHAQRLDAVGRLAGGVAHDFNNLLTVILGNAAVLEADADDDTKQMVHEVLQAAERASQLTRQLLQFSRRDRPHPTEFDVLAAASDLAPLLDRMLGENVTLAVDGRQGCRVRMDRGRLEQVLINVVLNARDAMPEGGEVRIVVGCTEHVVEIRVEDDGPGMEAAIRERAFEPFFTTKAAGEGTGLGLAVVHGIVSGVNGAVTLEAPESGGTQVAIRLPRAKGDAPTSPKPTGDRSEERALRVLVVEDEAVVLATVRRVLRLAGHKVTTAADRKEAMAAMSGSPMDLVLSDVILPGDTGPAIVDALQAAYGPQRVLYMSGYPADALDMASDERPRLLAKPFTPDDLLQAVDAAARAPVSPRTPE